MADCVTNKYELILKSEDHPEANGRRALSGELAWTLTVPLEDGRTLRLRMGLRSRAAFKEMLLNEMIDDMVEPIA